jgi:NADH dehydrogenase [ubiquinone] 1 alpha subcomplex assembly factor 7
VTPLEEKLIRRISATGPMSIAEYMAACLGDPEYGYYLTREPFGMAGDFVTAPEISQMFGELIGLWAVAAWEAMGAPDITIVEAGPGRGTLMADMLRAARIRPRFATGHVCLIETSRRLRAVQEKTLAGSGATIIWHHSVDEIPAGPMIFVANEFFDALPVRQFVKAGNRWAERMVGLGDDGRLAFGLRPAPAPPGREVASDGSLVEISDASTAIMATIAERLVRYGGTALIIDYGYFGPAYGDTFQAARRHRYDDPLAAPGEADLTAHVDFGALANAAKAAGATARPLMDQGEFLLRMGLAARAEALAKDKDQETAAAVRAAAERLAGPDMGTLFKVMAVSAPGLALPIFDDNPAGTSSREGTSP